MNCNYLLYFSILPLVAAFVYILLYFREKKILKAALKEIIGCDKIANLADIIKIKNYLSSKITYTQSDKTAKRPLLRATAVQTLKSGKGLCGENSRLAVLLLNYGGVRANRVYLYGKLWQHVVCEFKWGGTYYLFDGHNDPETSLKDELVGKILSSDINSYPNGYTSNPWIDYCRIKILWQISFLKFISKMRPHLLSVYIFENPYLIKSIFFLFLAMLTVLISIIL